MKANIFNRPILQMATGICMLFFLSCERDITDLELAGNPTNPEVFIDGFSAGLNYAAFGGSVPAAFDVDRDVTYNNSEASMRFEVPDEGDPRGAYAGGVFFTDAGRDLSGYNVLTFRAKASKAASINEIGFGNDLGENKYVVSIAGLNVNTNWKKYYIPIPDPSKLTSERGLFWYAEGPEEGKGYTFWIDEVKFETLGTIAHPQFAILNGEDQVETSFAGVSKTIGGLISTFNLPTGVNQTVNLTPAYFDFFSSDESIATVDDSGNIMVTGGPGNARVTAQMGDIPANGSLTIQSVGVFQHAPTPMHPADRVISIFSDAYSNVPVDYYNGYWAPYQTTLSADFEVGGDHILHYTDFNFVGIEFSSPTVNASEMTHLHLNIYIPNTLTANAPFRIELVDFGTGGTGVFTSNISVAQSRQWLSLDIPLSNFSGLSNRANLAQIIFVDVNNNISSFYVDNVYFRKN